MAQLDTGLGWSANDTWLTSGANIEVASLVQFVSASLPAAPTGSTVNDMRATDFWYRGDGGHYCAMAEPGVTLFVFYVGTRVIFCGSLQTEGAIWGTDGWFRGESATIYGNISPTDIDSVTGLRYTKKIQPGSMTKNPAIPTYSSISEGLATITAQTTQFVKTNAGYAVACVAKWYTSNGTALNSPILISTDSEFTEMTGSGSYNMATFERLLSGRRFYMSFWDIPLSDTVDSTFPEADLLSRGNIDLEQLFMIIASTSYSHIIIITSPDPYEEEGGGSGEEGGDGEDLEDDEMGISHHAIPAAINTGFCRIYCPSEQQLRALSNYLWSAQYDLAAVKKLFANPMDSVLGLSAVPLTLGGANHAVYLGGVDTEMSFPMVSYQSYQVPMGAITVEKRWGSYLDYDPYTKFSIYLPFIGFKDLSADDIMGKQIILDYDVDILSGACTARLQVGANVLYQWSGQCSIQLPVTASNWNQVFQSATSAALSAGLSVATGTAGPVLAGALAAEGAQAIMGKPRIERGGTASGAAGWMGGLTPYLVRVTPEAIIPNDQNKFIGYPAFSSISLGDLSGYNEISSIHLEGIPATGAELEELEAILKGGVIF